MPAAAVIPAPIAYIKVVAVKKLVVECRAWPAGVPRGTTGAVAPCCLRTRGCSLNRAYPQAVYCEEIRVFMAGRSA